MHCFEPHDFYAQTEDEKYCILAVNGCRGYLVCIIREGEVEVVLADAEVDGARAWIRHLMFCAREDGRDMIVQVNRLLPE